MKNKKRIASGNNQVIMTGKLASNLRFSHQRFGECFYLVDVQVSRRSSFKDEIPVMVSERILDGTAYCIGKYVEIRGQYRSFRRYEEKRSHLILYVFAQKISFIKDEYKALPSNEIFLDGYICKPPVYRTTPLGREIADVLLAVNRTYGRSDYIPCIFWGRNARYAPVIDVGGHTHLWGRIQSREYRKWVDEERFETRIAYEVSVNRLEYLDDSPIPPLLFS